MSTPGGIHHDKVVTLLDVATETSVCQYVQLAFLRIKELILVIELLFCLVLSHLHRLLWPDNRLDSRPGGLSNENEKSAKDHPLAEALEED